MLGPDFVAELGRRQDLGVPAPAEHGAAHIREKVEAERQLDAAVWLLRELLGGMFPRVECGVDIECHPDFEFGLAHKTSEAAPKILLHVALLRGSNVVPVAVTARMRRSMKLRNPPRAGSKATNT